MWLQCLLGGNSCGNKSRHARCFIYSRLHTYQHVVFTLRRHCYHVWHHRDKPEDIGYPPVEGPDPKKVSQADKPKPDIWAALVNNVLKNPFIWGMALTYFFIYVVRQVRAGAWVFLCYCFDGQLLLDRVRDVCVWYGPCGRMSGCMRERAMP